MHGKTAKEAELKKKKEREEAERRRKERSEREKRELEKEAAGNLAPSTVHELTDEEAERLQKEIDRKTKPDGGSGDAPPISTEGDDKKEDDDEDEQGE